MELPSRFRRNVKSPLSLTRNFSIVLPISIESASDLLSYRAFPSTLLLSASNISDTITKYQNAAIVWSNRPRLIPLTQPNQTLGLAGQIRNRAGFEFFGRS